MSERQKKFILEPQFYQLTLSKWRWNREEVLSSNLLGEDKGVLKVQVFDIGCGMTPEEQTMLFQRFFQANRNPGHRKMGAGLGL